MKHLTTAVSARFESERDLSIQSFSISPDMPALARRAVERLSPEILEAMAREDSIDIADRILSQTEQFRTDFARLLGD
jgi:hypothetical protein